MLFFLACSTPSVADEITAMNEEAPALLPVAGPNEAVAVFAGGCFWCMESDFDSLAGVVHTTSGYAGGHTKNPTYADVTTETTGHAEGVHVVYDPRVLSYDTLLDYYWHHTDPTDGGGQFCDRGDSYRPAIFTVDAAQKASVEASKAAIEASGVLGKPIATQVVPLEIFWPAENYHQNYHHENPSRYLPYRMGCGRDRTVKAVWAKAK